MQHPTPAAIRAAIFKALNEAERAENDPLIKPIPVRVWNIVDDAISRACDQAKG